MSEYPNRDEYAYIPQGYPLYVVDMHHCIHPVIGWQICITGGNLPAPRPMTRMGPLRGYGGPFTSKRAAQLHLNVGRGNA